MNRSKVFLEGLPWLSLDIGEAILLDRSGIGIDGTHSHLSTSHNSTAIYWTHYTFTNEAKQTISIFLELWHALVQRSSTSLVTHL